MFGTAERHLDASRGALAHDVAIVRFNLAMSLQEVARYDESRSLLAESKQVFRDHRDVRNYVLCGEFTLAGLNARAMTALDYLSKAIAARP